MGQEEEELSRAGEGKRCREKEAGMRLCILSFTFIPSLPCLPTIWHVIPTSCYISKVFQQPAPLTYEHLGMWLCLFKSSLFVVMGYTLNWGGKNALLPK